MSEASRELSEAIELLCAAQVDVLLGDINGPLDVYLFGWPSGPSWLYALTQGLHVIIGLALFPFVLIPTARLGRRIRPSTIHPGVPSIFRMIS